LFNNEFDAPVSCQLLLKYMYITNMIIRLRD